MKRYRLRKEAKQELRDAARWLEAKEEGLGIELLAQFDETLGFALASPGAGTVKVATVRGAVSPMWWSASLWKRPDASRRGSV